MCSLQDADSNATNNTEEVIRAAEKLYTELYKYQRWGKNGDAENYLLNYLEVPHLSVEVKKVRKGINRSESGDNGISMGRRFHT